MPVPIGEAHVSMQLSLLASQPRRCTSRVWSSGSVVDVRHSAVMLTKCGMGLVLEFREIEFAAANYGVLVLVVHCIVVRMELEI